MPIQSYFNPQTGRVEQTDSVNAPQFANTGYSGIQGWNPTTIASPQANQISNEQRNVTQNVQAGSDFSGYQNTLQDLLRDPSKVQQTAGYKFAFDQGNQAINRSAAKAGMLNSGNALAELAKYGQGMASQQYDTEANRLAGLMRNAQQFGLASEYIKTPQAQGQWVGGAYQQPIPQASWY